MRLFHSNNACFSFYSQEFSFSGHGHDEENIGKLLFHKSVVTFTNYILVLNYASWKVVFLRFSAVLRCKSEI